MPVDVSKLKGLYPEPPLDKHESLMTAMRPIKQSLRETLEAQQSERNKAATSALIAQAQLMRAEAEARQATIDARDLVVQQNETLKQLLEESRAHARSWKSTAISLGIALITVLVGWLLTAVNAAQVLSHLVHH